MDETRSARESSGGAERSGLPGQRPDGGQQSKESTKTVLLAGGANFVLALAKGVAGVLTGSSAMLAESVHSVADTLNQVFLLTALRRSERPADAAHPFGYGKERYFWALLAAVGIFVLGGGFAIFEGIETIVSGESHQGSYLVAYVVLAVAFVAEGTSWVRAAVQLRREAADRRMRALEHVATSPEPASKTVAFEDSAALVGIVLAAVGVGLQQLTGSPIADGAASVAIGLLLIGVAYGLGRDNMRRLVGTSVDPKMHASICRAIESFDEVDRVVELLTMRLGPDEVIAAAKVDLAGAINAEDVERASDDIDRHLREQIPQARHVYLDPTAREQPNRGDASDREPDEGEPDESES